MSSTADATVTAPIEPFKVGEPLPARMTPIDMRRAFTVQGRVMGRSTFDRLVKQGRFRRFELRGDPVNDKAWSGAKVARHLTGESFAIVVKRA